LIKEYFLNYEAMNNDLTISLGKQNSTIYHGAHDEQDYHITLANTGLETMTGGRIKQVEKYIDGDLFLVTYGDGVADLDINQLVAFHRSHGRLATVTTVRPTSRFGVLDIASDGHVSRFSEKPVVEGWISAGFFVFNRRVFDYIGNVDCVLEQEPLEKLAREGELVAYRHPGFFYAMDTYREYKYLNELWSAGQAPWKIWE
jgi:glucose-1-phosphate cytidylyltransferase